MSLFFIGHPSEQDLALFAGGELGPLSRWRIERHLETCSRCEKDVADFFHLRDEMSPLADLPEVDWTRMAREVEARVATEAPAPAAPSRSWGWQLGLAAACAAAIVAVAVRSPVGETLKSDVEAELQVASDLQAKSDAEMESAPASEGLRAERKQEEAANEAAADRVAGAPRRQTAPAPEPAAFTDSAEEADLAAPLVLAESFSADEARERSRAADDAGRSAGTAVPAAALSRDLTSAVGSLRGPAPAEPRVLPPLDADARLALDGSYEIRAMSAEGVFTITEVYAQ